MEQQKQITQRVRLQVDLLATLRELLFAAKPKVLSVSELAHAVGVAESTFYNKVNGQSPFTADEYIAIARAYSARGEFRVSELVVLEGYSIAPVDCKCFVNGSLDDELGDFTELAGQARTEFEQGNREGVLKLIPRMRPILNRMEKEAKS